MAQNKNQKLELTWIGKGNEPKLEPRILIEDPSKGFGDSKTENILIHGDNLLALKALEQSYSGRIKCICIDPPYNTGSAFDHYDDGIEHSIWLSLMNDRLNILYNLLSPDGTIWIAIDDNECHYLKVMCDEIFGRSCFIATIAWRSGDAPNNDSKQFSIDHNSILVYSKNPEWRSYALPRTEESNAHYKNPDNDPKGPWFSGNVSSPNPRPNLRYNLTAPNGKIIEPPANGWRWSKERMNDMISSGEVIFSNDGSRIIKKTYLIDQKGLSPSSIWYDIEDTGHNRQAKYELIKLFPEIATSELFKTPKPEKLIRKILQISTKENDWVLDSFLGSATTSAVAHKMNRKWIGIEIGEHCYTYCIPRMQKVINGSDKGGITEAVNWKGGGGFKFYTLAPSLLKEDQYGNWIISEEYNADMLAAAMAKQEGFKYQPHESIYWKQGQSSEKDFIFTTTQFVTVEMLNRLHEEMKPDESLLICCRSFKQECEGRFGNITIKKIPQMLLGRCEFGKNDYSLNIVNIPRDEEEDYEPPVQAIETIEVIKNKTQNTKKKADDHPTLF